MSMEIEAMNLVNRVTLASCTARRCFAVLVLTLFLLQLSTSSLSAEPAPAGSSSDSKTLNPIDGFEKLFGTDYHYRRCGSLEVPLPLGMDEVEHEEAESLGPVFVHAFIGAQYQKESCVMGAAILKRKEGAPVIQPVKRKSSDGEATEPDNSDFLFSSLQSVASDDYDKFEVQDTKTSTLNESGWTSLRSISLIGTFQKEKAKGDFEFDMLHATLDGTREIFLFFFMDSRCSKWRKCETNLLVGFSRLLIKHNWNSNSAPKAPAKGAKDEFEGWGRTQATGASISLPPGFKLHERDQTSVVMKGPRGAVVGIGGESDFAYRPEKGWPKKNPEQSAHRAVIDDMNNDSELRIRLSSKTEVEHPYYDVLRWSGVYDSGNSPLDFILFTVVDLRRSMVGHLTVYVSDDVELWTKAVQTIDLNYHIALSDYCIPTFEAPIHGELDAGAMNQVNSGNAVVGQFETDPSSKKGDRLRAAVFDLQKMRLTKGEFPGSEARKALLRSFASHIAQGLNAYTTPQRRWHAIGDELGFSLYFHFRNELDTKTTFFVAGVFRGTKLYMIFTTKEGELFSDDNIAVDYAEQARFLKN